MKSSELIIGHDYAVVPSWEYSSQDKKDPTRVRRQDVAKAKLVSLQKYEYRVVRSESQDDSGFVPAQQGSRTVGYLVASDKWVGQGTTGTLYWLARPQDIIAIWGTLEPRWAEEERFAEEQKKREAIEAQKREEERRLIEEKRARYETATRDSLRAILGNRVTDKTVQFNNRYRADNEATVELSADLVSILIEKVLEAKDLVG